MLHVPASANYAASMSNPTQCEGCGNVTATVHGRCPNCWHVKGPGLVAPPSTSDRTSIRGKIADELLSLALFLPGVALTVVAVVLGGEEVLLVIGVVLLLSGGAVRFWDFIP